MSDVGGGKGDVIAVPGWCGVKSHWSLMVIDHSHSGEKRGNAREAREERKKQPKPGFRGVQLESEKGRGAECPGDGHGLMATRTECESKLGGSSFGTPDPYK